MAKHGLVTNNNMYFEVYFLSISLLDQELFSTVVKVKLIDEVGGEEVWDACVLS